MTNRLRRVVSRWEIVALSLNDVVGSGIYLLPAAAAALLGFASLWAVVLAGLAVLLIVLCFAEAATHFDEPGGAYVYTRAAFGELPGFLVGWMTWLTRVAAVASLSVGFSQALGFLWPAAEVGWGRAVAIALPLALLTWINVVGVKAGARTAVFLVIAKVVPLLVLVGAGLVAARRETALTQAVTSEGGLGEAALLLLFAYAGFENTAAPAGEFRRPQRDIPFALIVQIGLVTLLYVVVQWVALGTLPDLASSTSALAEVGGALMGSWGGLFLTVGAVVSILGTMGNTVLAGPRYLFALADGGYGPRFLAGVHPRYRTPAAAVVFQTVVALPLALSGSFVGLAALSVVARLATYLGTIVAVPVLRRKFGSVAAEGTFRLPGGWLIPALAAVVTLGLAASATPRDLLTAGVAMAVGWLILPVLAKRRPATK